MKKFLSNLQRRAQELLKHQATPIALVLVVVGVMLRIVPHLPNFAPIAAIALFGGLYLPRRIALGVPIVAMLLSDAVVGWYSPKIMFAVYISFVIVGLIGLSIRRHKSVGKIVGASIGGSVLFYLITNFAVWAFGAMYPHTWTGLLECYYLALPFFRNTFLGDMSYAVAFIGGYELVMWWSKQPSVVPAVNFSTDKGKGY